MSPSKKTSGLAVKPDDCPVTRCVRAALYATDLEPTEDDVLGLVVSIQEDLEVAPKLHDSGNIITREIRICADCYELRGKMCHTPECSFCRFTMKEVAEYLDRLNICPVIDGVRHKF